MAYTGDVKRKYDREWRAARRSEFFADKVCAHCGGTQALELDHIDPATKVDHVIWSWSKERRDAETAKCQVLCHPCHKAKTRANHENPGGHRKLTAAQADVIRVSTKTLRALAIEYGVAYSTIGRIKRRETRI